jgi:hypothetical protein
MPVTDWTETGTGLFGAPPNCGAGCSANSWNVPSYDPDRDSIPSLQIGLIDKLPQSPPLVGLLMDYKAAEFPVADPGSCHLIDEMGSKIWPTNPAQNGYLSFATLDLGSTDQLAEFEFWQSKLPAYLSIQVPTGILVWQVFDISFDTGKAFVGNDTAIEYISGPDDPVAYETGLSAQFSETAPVVSDPQNPPSPVFFYTTVDTVTGPGQIALDSVPVSDDWGAPTNQFKSIQVHKIDTRSVDHSPFINSLGSGGLVRISHPNGVAYFTVNGVIEFDPEYGILLQYSSGDLAPVGLGQEIAIDFLPAGVL